MSVDRCALCGGEFDMLSQFGYFPGYSDRKCHKVCVEMDRSANVLIDKIINVLENNNQ